MKESIVNLTGYKGYKVSNRGRILDNNGNEVELNQKYTAQFNKPYVDLWKDGRCYTEQVAKLVAKEFCKEGADDIVHHIDGNEFNNCADNLQYTPIQEDDEIDPNTLLMENIKLACKYGPSGYRESDYTNYDSVKSEARKIVDGVVDMFMSFPAFSCIPKHQRRDVIIKDRRIKIDYDLSIDELRVVNTRQLLLDHVEDTLWVLDFMKCAIRTIVKDMEENASYRFQGAHLVPQKNTTNPKNIKSQVIKTLHLDLNDEIDQNLTRLIDKINIFNQKKEEVSTIIEEERFKSKILSLEDYELEIMFREVDDDCILNYLIKYDNRKKAEEILDLVRKVFETKGYTPKNLKLTIEDDWITKLSDELGINKDEEYEEDDIFCDETDPELIEMFDKQIQDDIAFFALESKKERDAKKVVNATKASCRPISIKHKETGEVHSFESNKECMEFLNLPQNTYLRFKKGTTKTNKIWEIVNNPE